MKPTGINGNSSGASKAQRKPNNIRTHRNDETSRDQIRRDFDPGVMGEIVEFCKNGIKSWFGAYIEAGVAIGSLVKETSVDLKNKVVSLALRFKKKKEVVNVEIPVERAPEQIQQTQGNINQTKNITHFSFTTTNNHSKVEKPEKTFLKLNILEFIGKNPSESAYLILQKIEEKNYPCDKLSNAYKFLEEVAFEELSFEYSAIKHFRFNKREQPGPLNTEQIKLKAVNKLKNFLTEITNDQELAGQITNIICVDNQVEVDITPEQNVSEEILPVIQSEPVIVQELPVSDVAFAKDEVISLPMLYPASLSDDLLELSSKSGEILGINNEDLESFLSLVSIHKRVFSSLSQEEVSNRIMFLHTLASQTSDNTNLRLNLNTLQEEYNAFNDYFALDENIKSFLGIQFNRTKRPDFNSYLLKKEVGDFLSCRVHTALKEAKIFIKTLASLDEAGAEGVIRLLKKATSAKSEINDTPSNPAYGFYVKAEAGLSLLNQFKRAYPKAGDISMRFLDPSVKSTDIILETPNLIFMIKVKSNTKKAIQGIKELESLSARTRFESMFGEGKKIIPVCLINGIGDTIIDLENRKKGIDREGIKQLLGISSSNPDFGIWDINGNDRKKELDNLLSEGQNILYKLA